VHVLKLDRIEFKLAVLILGLQTPTPDSSAVPRWGIPLVICWRGLSASPLYFDIIACCPTHPSFNHQRSSFSGRCCPTVEHCRWTSRRRRQCLFSRKVWRPISSVIIFLQISCSTCVVFVISDTIIDLFYLLYFNSYMVPTMRARVDLFYWTRRVGGVAAREASAPGGEMARRGSIAECPSRH